ncbi:hypothetical protein DNTS_021962 [Danionella cerebrum]|uniref:Nuclear mitotic apparatus protein 1 N-terminal hook domain-containing protein n=1 Tax=Danionella cerebrum TaxID=2873325 RepID=A0A553QLM8_9TELE|nr:hypothetical protein DNTS_021962 [Danionella translucida]TRY90892.1 hypothetical protein DNTS_021962 [Danionella translucida]
MKFSKIKAMPLLAWINAMFPERQIRDFAHLRDGFLLLQICYKLIGKNYTDVFKASTLYQKVEVIFNFLRDEFHLNDEQRNNTLNKINEDCDTEFQLAKVALLLCYCSFKRGNSMQLGPELELEITSIFRFVKEDADGLSLDEGIDKFLHQDFVNVSSTESSRTSSTFYNNEDSPLHTRSQHLPKVQFQELYTVASSSDGSPMLDVMSTPHFQLKKLRKELAHEEDVRDELEKELAIKISIISEKESLIFQLQYRVERMLRDQADLEKEHKAALLELQEKNQSLLQRMHEVLKQCQDLKTDNSQKEKKIDELTEESGTLTVEVRKAFGQLARAEEEMAKIRMIHESAQTEWRNRKDVLERELNEAVTHRECLSEQVLILQGKISILEDELHKAQTLETGEVLGPILEWEKLKQELSDLTLKLTQLQEIISHLEKEKAETETLLVQERCSFEKETNKFQMRLSDLEESLSTIRLERETLKEALMSQKEMLSSQISALEKDVSRLQQVEVQLMTEIKISADLRKQREDLEGKVASLDKTIVSLRVEIQGLAVERASQQKTHNALFSDLQCAKNTIQEYKGKLDEHQKVLAENDSLKSEACTLQRQLSECLETIDELQEQLTVLRSEKIKDADKVREALIKIEVLQSQIQGLSENICLKDEQIQNLKMVCESVDEELKHVKDRNAEINEMIKTNNREHEETVKKLKQELQSTASEKQKEILVLSAEVYSLKEQVCTHTENEAHKQTKLFALEEQHNALKENLSSLQKQLDEATTTVAQKQSMLILLQQELSNHETLREKAEELGTLRCEELEKSLNELQTKIQEVSKLSSEKDACLNALQEEMKVQELVAKQSEDVLRNELNEKIANLKGLLDAANSNISDKDNKIALLNETLERLEVEGQQKERETFRIQTEKEDLEKKIVAQNENCNALEKNFENLTKERDHLTDQVSFLQKEISQNQKDMAYLQKNNSVLKENLASVQTLLKEASYTMTQRDSEVVLLQQELSFQETEREKAQELEIIKREELEMKVKDLEANFVEVTGIVSQKEAQLISLQVELKDQQMNATQAGDLCRKLEEKVEIVQGELDVAMRGLVDKEHKLEFLDQKLKEMEVVLVQKEMDSIKTLREKEETEKTIEKLIMEKQHLEFVVKDRNNLFDDVSSLKEEIRSHHDTDLQKQLTISVLERECNALKERMACLEEKLVKESMNASEKESEVVLLQSKLHQQETHLQDKIQEMSTVASVKEELVQSLQEELNNQLKVNGEQATLLTKLEEKVETLQSILEDSSHHISRKDSLLQSSNQKLEEMELLLQQKNEELLQIKDDFVKLKCKRQLLEDCHQNLEMVKKERDLLSTKVSSLKEEVRHQQLIAKESEDKIRKELEVKFETLKGQMETVVHSLSEKDKLLETLNLKLNKMDLLLQQKEKDVIESLQVKDSLQKKVVELQAHKSELDDEHQQNLEMLSQEKEHLRTLNQSLQREYDASLKIRAEQNASLVALKKASRQWEEQKQELQDQLKLKAETAEHYKAQVEKAKNHYNGKKQLLLESQELNKTLEHSLEASKKDTKTLKSELTRTRMELEQTNAKVKTLQAQVDMAEKKLQGCRKKSNEYVKENQHPKFSEKRQQDVSTDSLEFELNDSLTANSTPLLRSSERLAAKRRELESESLETLYFTPMGQQGMKRKGDHNDIFERKLESSITSIGDLVVDSAKKLSASERRRRTTQVINISMAKMSQGHSKSQESFSSLHSAQSQPNLAMHHSRPLSFNLSDENTGTMLSKADTLQTLPGYRRSTAHSMAPPRATSTFCIGAENEPEHAGDDWMRIAELQSRNKACLPHLKSSYPLESRPSLGPSFTITDDDMRMGDPNETIRRASMMPSQIMESLNSHRFSLGPGPSQPQHATTKPGQTSDGTASLRGPQVTKNNSYLQVSGKKRPGSQIKGPDTPEAKKLASCFPRPLTPKGRFINSQNRPPNSPAERRQSEMFVVVNTPKNSGRGDSRLQRGLNKLRNSARKSPRISTAKKVKLRIKV